jgi:uncharacterized protein (TIGR03437 family)
LTRKLLLFLSILAFKCAAASNANTAFFSNLPLRFEENRGQSSHKNARYIARGPDFVMSLAPDRNWMEWSDRGSGNAVRLQTRLQNANPSARMRPEKRLEGSANYFIGRPEQWQTDVAGFGSIHYENVYPGIDLIFHGEQGRLEYDFVLAPHADPSAIRLEVSGQRGARVNASGDLVISTAAGELEWKHPEIYQTSGGTRHPVEGRFLVSGGNLVRFDIGEYDPNYTLVIDPALKYSTYIGGHGNDSARGIGVDGAGNVYVGGTTSTSDLNTVSAFQPNFGGGTASPLSGDGFVAKFSPTGTLLYLTYLGGSYDDGIYALAVDSAGNAYVTGGTNSTDFPVVNAFQSAFAGSGGSLTRSGDAFVAKLNPTGNKLLYSTYLGGNQDDIGLAIAIDSSGNAYVAGATASPNFPLTPGGTPYQNTFGGAGGEPIRHETDTVPEWEPGDGFAAKLDPTGSKLLFSTFLGGNLDDAAMAIAVDSASNVYVGGCTISANFPVQNALQSNFGGTDPMNIFFSLGDGFIVKLNPSGSNAIYSTYLGGSGDDCIIAIALDSSGDLYATGTTTSLDLPVTPGAFQRVFRGYVNLPLNIAMGFGDAFVAKLNPAGSQLSYLTYLGGSFNDGGTGIAVDSAGDAFVTGFTDSFDFFTTPDALQPKIAGDGGISQFLFYGDMFLTVLNPTGSALYYSSYFGGNEDERTLGLTLDGSGAVYIVGNTVSGNLPTTPNAYQNTYGGIDGHVDGAMRGDAFLAIFSGFPLAAPIITIVANAEGENPVVAANTWTEIKGSNLSATTRIWGNSDFVNNQLPTKLDTVSVTMNGEPVFVYYISPSQIDVLTPPDLAPGPVKVQVSNGFVSAPFTVQGQQYSTSFFVINGGPYVVATHADGSLIGPASLFPGATTPATPGETIVLYANGFGPVVPPVVSGSLVQAGVLSTPPVVQIGGSQASVLFAGLISPGLFQINVTVPAGAATGDNPIVAQYGGQSTQAGTLLTVQQ